MNLSTQATYHFPLFRFVALLSLSILINISTVSAQDKDYLDEANVYFNKAWSSFSKRDVKTGTLYADSTRQVYAKANDKYGEGIYMFLIGAAEKTNGNYTRSDSLFKAFLPYLQEKKDTAFLASLYFQMGIVTKALGDLDGALDHHYKSINYYHQNNDTLNTNDGLNAIGSIYRELKQYDLAKKHYLDALDINKRRKSLGGQATNLVNLGNLYAEQEQYDVSIDYYNQAVYFDSITNFSWGLAYDYENIGTQYAKLKNYKAAKIQLDKALDIRLKLGGKYELAQSYLKLGELYTETGDPKKAIQQLNNAQGYANDAKAAESIKDIYKAKSRAYDKMGQYKAALNNHQLYVTHKDSILNKNTSDKIASLNVAFETEKKQTQIALLNTKNDLAENKLASARWKIYGLGLGLLIVGLLSFFIYKLYSKTQHQNSVISKALLEKETLLKEIHHRVKNNLQFISSLLGLQTEHVSDQVALDALQEGQDRVQSMALIHQNLYQEDNLTGVDMKEYFTKLVRGLFDSYNIRRDQVTLDLDIQDLNLDVDTVIPIGLVVNELVSNSLKYAFPEKRKGVIKVSLREADKALVLSVADDGIGITPEQKQNLGSSFGYRLVSVFKDQLKADLDISGDNGTDITMSIKKYQIAS